MNNLVFGEVLKICNDRKKKKLFVIKASHNTKKNSQNLLATEMRQTQIIVNKPVYLGLSILQLCKTVMYGLWYDYVKSKYGQKVKLCHTWVSESTRHT